MSAFTWHERHSVDRPCPPWCTDTTGHGWGIENATGRQVRIHSRDLSDNASLVVDEYADESGVTRPPGIQVWVDGSTDGSRQFTSTEVRQLAADLLNATDDLDRITGAVPWTEDQL